MRQKNVKNATLENLNTGGVITTKEKVKLDHRPTFLEIGSGKGQFITGMASDHLDAHFIALEVNINVCYRIFEKKQLMQQDHLTIILGDANNLDEYFESHTLSGIYLNFSDPWPKAKHHKRRLTYPTFLEKYKALLKPNGFIQFRTDHHDLFMDSLEYFSKMFDIYEKTEKLSPSSYMTEYEVKKRQDGPIYQLKAKVKSHA